MRKLAPSDFFLHRLAVPRLLAAGSLLAIGAVHLQQYIGRYYRVIPTIGPLFLLNFIAATVLGLYLLVPARARVSRVRLIVDTTVALSGIGIAAGGLVDGGVAVRGRVAIDCQCHNRRLACPGQRLGSQLDGHGEFLLARSLDALSALAAMIKPMPTQITSRPDPMIG